MSDTVALLIADLISANVPPELVGRVAAAIAGKTAIKTTRAKAAYSADFEEFWKAYPTDPNMSKHEAWQQWQKIDETERGLAMQAVPRFKEYCKANAEWYRPVHAVRFLSKKRFEGHAQPELKIVASNNGIYVLQSSPDWPRYAAVYRAEKNREPPVDKKGGWWFPVETRQAVNE